MKNFILKLIIVLVFTSPCFAQTEKNLIFIDSKTNKLVYQPYTVQGDIIPDFSYCGYKGGGVKIVVPKIVKTLFPLHGDNTKSIQNALDSVGLLKADENGIRGAVLLMPGRYNISASITIKHAGVALIGDKA